jgi:hypothetical protein
MVLRRGRASHPGGGEERCSREPPIYHLRNLSSPRHLRTSRSRGHHGHGSSCPPHADAGRHLWCSLRSSTPKASKSRPSGWHFKENLNHLRIRMYHISAISLERLGLAPRSCPRGRCTCFSRSVPCRSGCAEEDRGNNRPRGQQDHCERATLRDSLTKKKISIYDVSSLHFTIALISPVFFESAVIPGRIFLKLPYLAMNG